ncbi:MAG: hypothetical protein KKC68_01155, partial [Candidatus Thermoplasmatota archaeon]|nr:hypothetical protein [Candidatus Thermoplasmatota archaeon]MBU1940358.1 hypothetical protein [Candidatus Thermoplasmatota archaeon]
HPTVADNFQDGIPPASNFHTAKSEKEGVAVLITRLLEGNVKENNNEVSAEVSEVFTKHLGQNATRDIALWITTPEMSPSYHQPIGSEYDADLSKELLVGEQYPQNAFYQDIVQLINESLTDEEVTWLYHDIQDVTGWSIRYYGVEGYDTQIFNIFAFLSDKSLVLHALRSGGGTKLYNAEDDFIVIKYVGYRVNADGTPGTEDEWTTEELNALTDAERRRIVITDTTSENKPDYYKTMFYRTYVGDIPQEFENQVFQLPCWGMKHFTAEFVSEYPYFNTRRSAVVIAKYYEGAYINGSVRFNDASYNCEVVIQKDISYFGTTFGIDHDSVSTDANGSFSLIAPGGEISVQLRRNTELGANAFIMKTITLNSTEDPLFAPISDEEAMRKGAFIRELGNITIEPARVTGIVYENLDNASESFNSSNDLPLSDVEVTLIEITEFDESGQPIDTGEFKILATNASGVYTAEGLLPGIYVIRARLNDFIIHENYLFVTSGNNTYDIQKPQPAAIEGITYIDANGNAKYDTGEETTDVSVQLLYTTLEGTTMEVKQVKTDTTGKYGFADMIPGLYTLNATKENKNTGYLDYIIEQDISLIENTTLSQNLSLSLAPITVRGITRHDTMPIGGIRITFSPDTRLVNNTAEEVSVTSSTTGSYTANLLPGAYNVTIDFTVEEGIFSFSGDLTLIKGQGVQTYNLDLTKESITITGTTRYNNAQKANMSIIFQPASQVENNTAQYSTTISDEKGNYRAELKPGTYTVKIDETLTENNQNITYTYSAQLVITTEIPNITYDISLTKEER